MLDAGHYALNQWDALVRYTSDPRLSIDNNLSERTLRMVVIGRKNYLFAGSETVYFCHKTILCNPAQSHFLRYIPKGLFKADSVGNKLRAYRQLHGLTQKDLAKQLCIDPSTIMDWENQNHKISKKMFQRLKHVFLF